MGKKWSMEQKRLLVNLVKRLRESIKGISNEEIAVRLRADFPDRSMHSIRTRISKIQELRKERRSKLLVTEIETAPNMKINTVIKLVSERNILSKQRKDIDDRITIIDEKLRSALN